MAQGPLLVTYKINAEIDIKPLETFITIGKVEVMSESNLKITTCAPTIQIQPAVWKYTPQVPDILSFKKS